MYGPVGAVAGAVVARHRLQVGVNVALVGAVDGTRHARPGPLQGQRAGDVLPRDLPVLVEDGPDRHGQRALGEVDIDIMAGTGQLRTLIFWDTKSIVV